MIFVYSSTGNSLQLAEAVASEIGDEVMNILDVPEGPVDVSMYDRVGFVTPVYFFNTPRILRAFIDRLVARDGQEFFLVLTCGSTPDRACRKAARYFRKRGLDLTHSFAYRMPENYIALFSPPKGDKIDRMLDSVPVFAKEIAGHLSSEPCIISKHIGLLGLLTVFGDTVYDIMRGTKGFHVDDGCIGCGLCERICPDKAIRIEDGKPVWVIQKCEHCMGCINRCPRSVIQYKRRTQRRTRYVNPRVKLR